MSASKLNECITNLFAAHVSCACSCVHELRKVMLIEGDDGDGLASGQQRCQFGLHEFGHHSNLNRIALFPAVARLRVAVGVVQPYDSGALDSSSKRGDVGCSL